MKTILTDNTLNEAIRAEFEGVPLDVVVDLNRFDVSRVTDFSCLFEGIQHNFDISSWDTSSAQNVKDMFKNAENFIPLAIQFGSPVNDLIVPFYLVRQFNLR